MKLLVISHTPHIKTTNGIYGWGPTVNEINFLRRNFERVTHIAPVEISQQAPPSSYTEVVGVELVPTVNRGGKGIRAKLKVLQDSFGYARIISKHIRQADLIHVRCPANISLIALLVLVLHPRKRKWIKYAGDWDRKNDFMSYRIQRFLIRKRLSNHFATINSFPTHEPPFIHHFNNPSFYKQELEQARQETVDKSLEPNRWIGIFVGGLTKNKGAAIVVEAFRQVVGKHSGRLRLIGDGEEREELRRQIVEAGLENLATLEGWLNRDQLKAFYREAHFILLPSQGEGWPKVVSEGMAYGVVPIVARVSELEQMLKQFGTGVTIDSYVPFRYGDAIMNYLDNPEQWKVQSANALSAAEQFSMEDWWSKLEVLINKYKN